MWPAALNAQQLALVRAFDQANLENVRDRKSLREFFRLALGSSFPDKPGLRSLEFLEGRLNLKERAIRDLASRLESLFDQHFAAEGAGGRSLLRLKLNTLDRGQPKGEERDARYRIEFETNGKCHRFGLRNLLRPHFEAQGAVALVASANRTIGEALLRQTMEDALLHDGKTCVQEPRNRVPEPMKDRRDLILFGAWESIEIPGSCALSPQPDDDERVYLTVTRFRTRRDTSITVVDAASSEAYEGFNGWLRSDTALANFLDQAPFQGQLLGDQFGLLLSFEIDQDRELLKDEPKLEDWAGIEEQQPAKPKGSASETALPRHQVHRPARRAMRS